MKFIKKFNQISYIVEKSIGSESIRNKYYQNIPKRDFYTIVNIDPTSVRKKDFSKPGKYTKWLLRQYKLGNLNQVFNDVLQKDLINKYLFIFSTGWFKSKMKGESVYIDDEEILTGPSGDILKYQTLEDFIETISAYVSDYELFTENAKYDVVYSDEKVSILVPLNFASSYKTAQNTDWCSKSPDGFSRWNQKSIMFRIIPKVKIFDKVKITWDKYNGKTHSSWWHIACSKYPEITGSGSPFSLIDIKRQKKVGFGYCDHEVERWEWEVRKNDVISKNDPKWKENSKKITDTISLLSKEAKNFIEKYHHDKNIVPEI